MQSEMKERELELYLRDILQPYHVAVGFGSKIIIIMPAMMHFSDELEMKSSEIDFTNDNTIIESIIKEFQKIQKEFPSRNEKAIKYLQGLLK